MSAAMLKVPISGSPEDMAKKVMDLCDCTIRLKGDDMKISGSLPAPVAVATVMQLLTMLFEAAGERGIRSFIELWNMEMPGSVRLYAERDVRDMRTTIDSLSAALSAKEEGR